MNAWLLLNYKIQREPSARRVYVWRKLKHLGAVLLHDSVWVLPASPRTREQFQWLAAEIAELGGEAMLWTAEQVFATSELALRKQFDARAESAYRAILSKILRKGCDLVALSKEFQQTQVIDFFQHPLGQQAREKLIAAQDAAARRKRRRK